MLGGDILKDSTAVLSGAVNLELSLSSSVSVCLAGNVCVSELSANSEPVARVVGPDRCRPAPSGLVFEFASGVSASIETTSVGGRLGELKSASSVDSEELLPLPAGDRVMVGNAGFHGAKSRSSTKV